MTSIAAYPKQFFPWLHGLFAAKPADSVADLWQENVAFQHAVTALAAKLVKADGAAQASEFAAFTALFPMGQVEQKKLRRLFERQLQDRSEALQYARQIRAIGASASQRASLMDHLVQLANCDAPVNAAELELLRGVAKVWAIDADAFRASVARVLKSKSSMPHDVLGVSRHASLDIVRDRYLQQVRFLHPDQYAAAGASSDTIAILNERLADVNAAYHAMVGGRKVAKRAPRRHGLEPTQGARD